MYNALIEPNLTYCITIWGHSYKTYISKLHLLQKKMVRIINNSEYYAPTENIFKSLKIMTIYQLYEYFVAIYVYMSTHDKLPKHFPNYFQFNINRRHSDNLRPGYCSRKVCEFSVKFMGPKI